MAIKKQDNIESKIFTIRETQVILDKDLAAFYEVKPIRLREQVKRNPNRFPSDFVFQLNDKEVDLLVSQNAIPSKQSLGGYLPYVFSEQGVAAVSGVIKSDKAAEVSITIVRTFVKLRKFLLQNASVFQRLSQVELKQSKTDEKVDQIFSALQSGKNQPEQGVFFDGQIFDAYTFVSKVIKSAKSSIILIDNYVDESVLTLLTKREKNVKVIIYTNKITKPLQLDLKKHNQQYPKIEVKSLKTSHDRFLVIDKKELYHLGASLKDLGKKWFAFSRMDSMVNDVLDKLNSTK
jgi:hypothetical protein